MRFLTSLRHRAPFSAAICLALGIAHSLSFTPQPLWWVQLLVLAAFVGVLGHAQSGRAAARDGFAFGLGWFGWGVKWIFTSLHTYGEMALWLSASATFLFCAYLALYPALAAWTWHRLRGRFTVGWQAALFACAWAASEWLRATVLTGFPWIATGYAQVQGPLAGWAPVLGVHGLTLLTGFVAATLGIGLSARLSWRNRDLQCSAALLLTGVALGLVHWTAPFGAPISVRLLQGNVPQDVKFLPEHLLGQYERYYQLATAERADLIVMPETALPLPIQQSPREFFDALAKVAHNSDSTIVTGVFILETDAKTGEPQYTNSAIAIRPDAPTPIVDHRQLPSYRKYHLVAFGEFIPWGFRWFTDALNMPIGDQERGSVDQASLIMHRGQRLGMNICYEDYFGDEIAVELRRADAPSILINLTNIGWFGNSIALPQHLLASRMRALETGRPMLRATNTGVTAIVLPNGRVASELPPFEKRSLSGSVQGMQGTTPYVRWLDWPVLIVCFGGLLLALAIAIRRKR